MTNSPKKKIKGQLMLVLMFKNLPFLKIGFSKENVPFLTLLYSSVSMFLAPFTLYLLVLHPWVPNIIHPWKTRIYQLKKVLVNPSLQAIVHPRESSLPSMILS
uniref:Uncharacterized protein n=1 Tax=Solanum lycopersicum TaxID=4081 RepID=A0A3Q7H675_SOLLC